MDLEDAFSIVIELARQDISDDGVPDPDSEREQEAIGMIERYAIENGILKGPREGLSG